WPGTSRGQRPAGVHPRRWRSNLPARSPALATAGPGRRPQMDRFSSKRWPARCSSTCYLPPPRADIAVTNIPSPGSRRFAMTDVKPIPDGSPRVSPSLAIDGASAAIDFYTKVLGATEQVRIPAPGGTVAFARLQIGDSLINVSEESPERGYPGPNADGGTAVAPQLYRGNPRRPLGAPGPPGRKASKARREPVLRRPHRLVRGPLGAPLGRHHCRGTCRCPGARRRSR